MRGKRRKERNERVNKSKIKFKINLLAIFGEFFAKG